MGVYYVGDIFSSNPSMVNGCEEAVLVDFQIKNPEPYSIIFLQHSSIDGYYFEMDTRTMTMLDNAYVECITPHFCYIHNLYNLLSYYNLQLLGIQGAAKQNMKMLYFKAGKKYIQIILSNTENFYQNSFKKDTFVYVDESENFEDLKLRNVGNFIFFTNKKKIHLKDKSIETNTVGIDIMLDDTKIASIHQIKNWKRNNGLKIFNWDEFIACSGLEDFKNKIL